MVTLIFNLVDMLKMWSDHSYMKAIDHIIMLTENTQTNTMRSILHVILIVNNHT